MNDQIRVGIIGTGFTVGIANSHLKAYARCEHTRVAACYDKIPGRCRVFLDRFHERNPQVEGVEDIHICDTLEELFSMVDAVSLCVPNSEHVPLAIRAMEAGKHVIVEKPFALNTEQAREAVRVSREHPELVAMNAFNFREEPGNMYIRELVQSGVLGEIRFVRMLYGGGRINNAEGVFLEWRTREEKSGTGSMGDFGAHALDSEDWIFTPVCGPLVAFNAVAALNIPQRYLIDERDVMGGKLGQEKGPVTNDDSAQLSGVTASGTLFTLMTSRMNFLGNEYEVVGSNGCVQSSGRWAPGTVGLMLKDRPVPGQTEITGRMMQVEIPEHIMKEGDLAVGHYGVVCEFADCILNEKKPVRSLERGLYIQEEIDLFARSAAEGRTIYREAH